MNIAKITIVLSLVAMLIGCGGAPREGKFEAAECAGMTVTQAWARAAHRDKPTSAAYLTLCNGAGEDDILLGCISERRQNC